MPKRRKKKTIGTKYTEDVPKEWRDFKYSKTTDLNSFVSQAFSAHQAFVVFLRAFGLAYIILKDWGSVNCIV